jgi:hypothetical protein
LLDRGVIFSEQSILRVAIQIASQLKLLSQEHMAIKRVNFMNIMFWQDSDGNWNAKIIDLGSSVSLADKGGNALDVNAGVPAVAALMYKMFTGTTCCTFFTVNCHKPFFAALRNLHAGYPCPDSIVDDFLDHSPSPGFSNKWFSMMIQDTPLADLNAVADVLADVKPAPISNQSWENYVLCSRGSNQLCLP